MWNISIRKGWLKRIKLVPRIGTPLLGIVAFKAASKMARKMKNDLNIVVPIY